MDKHEKDLAVYKFMQEHTRWHSWDSPIGLSVFLGSLLISTGIFLWMLHLANILK
jgi:hypothetical protein